MISKLIFKLRILYFYLQTRYFRRFSDRKSLLRFQDRKLNRFLSWVKKHSLFYRNYLQSGTLKLSELPPIDKKIMMQNFSELNTVGIDRDEAFALAFKAEETRDFSPMLNSITIGLSSGTSGNRGLFLVSDLERARHAGTMLAKILPGSILQKHRVAFFMRANSNLYTASKSSRLEFKFFDLLSPLQEQLGELQEFNPTLLFAPPSMLRMLAQAQQEKHIQLQPQKIISIAESLDPLDRKKIEKAFGQTVHQVYQCTEGFLGITCKEGVLHLNEDCVRIEPEWLDSKHEKFVPIVTDFSRTSQPIIRYRLNDILTVRKKPCPCGSVLMALEDIEGRMDDMIYFEGTKTAGADVPVFPDFIRRSVIRASELIDEYMVTQNAKNELEIAIQTRTSLRLEETKKIHEEITAEIAGLAIKLNAQAPHLIFSDRLPELQGKKLRRIVQACNDFR